MLKIEAVIQPCKLDDVKRTLESLGVEISVISEVLHHGGPSRQKAVYRGIQYQAPALRVKLELLVSSEHADEVIDAILRSARTYISGEDDGTILAYELADAIRIRTGARLQYSFS